MGAIMANVIATEFVILAVYGVSLLFVSERFQLVLGILFVLALTFPLAFYHHSWAFWLGLDHLIESLPKANVKRL